MFPAEELKDPVPDPAAGAAEVFCVPVQPAIASAAQMRIIMENVTRYFIPERTSWSYMMLVLWIVSGRGKLTFIF